MSDDDLERLGLRPGEAVRFLRVGRDRWEPGRIDRAAGPDSVTVRDTDGGARTFRVDQLQVLRPDARGRLRWRSVADLGALPAQLELEFDA